MPSKQSGEQKTTMKLDGENDEGLKDPEYERRLHPGKGVRNPLGKRQWYWLHHLYRTGSVSVGKVFFQAAKTT